MRAQAEKQESRKDVESVCEIGDTKTISETTCGRLGVGDEAPITG